MKVILLIMLIRNDIVFGQLSYGDNRHMSRI